MKLIAKTLRSKVFENFLSLFSIQLINYILPIITFPYLIRVLGLELFGLVAFIQAVMVYLNSIVSYGFKLTGTDLIAKSFDNEDRKNQIFSEIIFTKLVLFLFCFVGIVSAVFLFGSSGENSSLYIIASLFVFGNLLFPEWYFQGVQEMKHIATFNVVARAVFTILIFVAVKAPEDYYLVVVLNSSSFLFGGVFSFLYAIWKFKIHIRPPSIAQIVGQLQSGFFCFLCRLFPYRCTQP